MKTNTRPGTAERTMKRTKTNKRMEPTLIVEFSVYMEETNPQEYPESDTELTEDETGAMYNADYHSKTFICEFKDQGHYDIHQMDDFEQVMQIMQEKIATEKDWEGFHMTGELEITTQYLSSSLLISQDVDIVVP